MNPSSKPGDAFKTAHPEAEPDYRSQSFPLPTRAPQPRLGPASAPGTPRVTAVENDAENESDLTSTGDWRTNLALFLLTVLSVFWVGRNWVDSSSVSGIRSWLAAWPFALPLLGILLAHEFGHYIAARLHRVPASLPYFLPLPIFNPFGTLGAVILMPKRIRSRRALLDIGAAGPLAGMALAIPLMIYGLKHSSVQAAAPSGIQEGQSLLYALLKWFVFGPIPSGHDVQLHPTALAAWAGFFVTFLNLFPFGQLDGGHVAYSLFGSRQDRASRYLPIGIAALVGYNFWRYTLPALRHGFKHGFGNIPEGLTAMAYAPTTWLILLVLLQVLRGVSGSEHPPVDDTRFGTGRRVIGILTLVLFVAIFMPAPWVAF